MKATTENVPIALRVRCFMVAELGRRGQLPQGPRAAALHHLNRGPGEPYLAAVMTAETFNSRQAAALPYVRAWLLGVAALIFCMVIVGGATRLTDSGLSITEWKPLLGAIPPFTEAHWLEAFEKYRQIPEYQLVNKGMSLDEFKFIYWWEWAHRFLGRVIGLAFFLPFAYFAVTGALNCQDGACAAACCSCWAAFRGRSAGTWSPRAWSTGWTSASTGLPPI